MSLDRTYEVVLVGAIGKAFTSMADLHSMTYNKALQISGAEACQKEVDKRHD